jgi:signal transduction histidine kinase
LVPGSTQLCFGSRLLQTKTAVFICGRRFHFGIIAVALAYSLGALGQTLSKTPITLLHADQVRRLTPEQAAMGYPVRVRGVITMDAPAPDFFVQDKTAGIFVEGSVTPKFTHLIGEFVELEGITGPGKFAPVIREMKLCVLGHQALPKAPLFPFSQLENGQQDSQWVQVRGIVRSAVVDKTSWHEPTLALRVASEGGEFNVRVPIDREQNFSSWVDSEVLIEGVCGSLYNADRQLTGVLFYVPRLSFIKIEASAKEVSVSALLRFSPGMETHHRVRLRGVVEYQHLGSDLFLQIQGKGLRVLTPQSTALGIGDVVDVLGFPAMGATNPILENAVFHRLAHGKEPHPVKMDFNKPWEQFDSLLVTTEAKLLSRQAQPDGIRLMLQMGDVLFDATLPSGFSGDPTVPLNSIVRVTGICVVRSGGLWRVPESFGMLLRSPQDVIVLRAPSWWNLRHAVWLLGITVSILLVVVAWVVLLGKRLREQIIINRQKLKHSAVLEERNRIARELHDTLEQELAGITMQLDLATDCFQQAPRVAKQALDTARDMSRHSMVEARRSVWDLRCQLLENGDLVSAISQVVEPLVSTDHAKVKVTISGTPVRLPGQKEMNLLRIAQEAVANAVKHGDSRNVMVELSYTAAAVCLNIIDDGVGFTASEAAPTGHFGLMDMRERAHSMGSRLNIQSEPGGGTHISLEVPLNQADLNHVELKANSYSGS